MKAASWFVRPRREKTKRKKAGEREERRKRVFPASYLRSEISISSRKKIGCATPRDTARETDGGNREGMK